MIGLGVGIDYALFIVTRFRENRQRGDTVDAAVTGAMDTAGRAVLFAGATVILALLGQLRARRRPALRPRDRVRARRPDHDAGRADRPAGAAVAVRGPRRSAAHHDCRAGATRGRAGVRARGCAGHTRSPGTPGEA